MVGRAYTARSEWIMTGRGRHRAYARCLNSDMSAPVVALLITEDEGRQVACCISAMMFHPAEYLWKAITQWARSPPLLIFSGKGSKEQVAEHSAAVKF